MEVGIDGVKMEPLQDCHKDRHHCGQGSGLGCPLRNESDDQ
jgi:hypothetical protein